MISGSTQKIFHSLNDTTSKQLTMPPFCFFRSERILCQVGQSIGKISWLTDPIRPIMEQGVENIYDFLIGKLFVWHVKKEIAFICQIVKLVEVSEYEVEYLLEIEVIS